MEGPALALEAVTKAYGRHAAVDGVTLSLALTESGLRCSATTALARRRCSRLHLASRGPTPAR